MYRKPLMDVYEEETFDLTFNNIPVISKEDKTEKALHASVISPEELSKKVKERKDTPKYPASAYLSSFCNSCKQEHENMNVCVKCKLRCYCSKECQTKDWLISHKLVCNEITNEGAYKAIMDVYITKQVMDLIYRLFCTVPRVLKVMDKQINDTIERVSFVSLLIINNGYEIKKTTRYGCLVKLCTYQREDYSNITKKAYEELKREYKEDIELENTYMVQIRRVMRTDGEHSVANGVYHYISDQVVFLLPTENVKDVYKEEYITDTSGKKIKTLELMLEHCFVVDGNVNMLPKFANAISMPSFIKYNPLPVPDEYLELKESLVDKMKRRRDKKKGRV